MALSNAQRQQAWRERQRGIKLILTVEEAQALLACRAAPLNVLYTLRDALANHPRKKRAG